MKHENRSDCSAGRIFSHAMLAHGQASMAKNDKAAQEVIDFRNRYIEAEENRDMAFLEKILADDFFALNPQGKLLNKAQQLENLKRPERTLKVLNPRETHVQFYGNGDVAVLTEHVTVDGHDNGEPIRGRISIPSSLRQTERKLESRAGARVAHAGATGCREIVASGDSSAKFIVMSERGLLLQKESQRARPDVSQPANLGCNGLPATWNHNPAKITGPPQTEVCATYLLSAVSLISTSPPAIGRAQSAGPRALRRQTDMRAAELPEDNFPWPA